MLKWDFTKIYMAMVLIIMLGFSGCATPQQSQSPVKIAYATIKSSAIAYDAIMSALGELDKQGKITDEQQTKIIKYGNEFWRAYHIAVDILYTHKKTGEGELNIEFALSTLTKALSSFLEYSSEITNNQEGLK